MKMKHKLTAGLFVLSAFCAASFERSTRVEGQSMTANSDVKDRTPPRRDKILTGQEAISGDWSTDAPGVRRLIKAADLPQPYDTKSVDNGPRMAARPDGAMPQVPAGFKVEEFACRSKTAFRAVNMKIL
jgi:hypothetical protein